MTENYFAISIVPASISEYVPQFVTAEESARRRRAALAAWAAVAAVLVALVGLIVLAPWARAHGHEALGAAVHAGFGAACHQMPERAFHLWGLPMAVCARCFGLYVGAAAGALCCPALRGLARREAPGRAWLLAAAAPTSVDFALGLFGVWENTHWSRFLTALLLGAAAAFYLVTGAVDLALARLGRSDTRLLKTLLEGVNR
ncbi:MAG TPA: DUF2085 domain-containing protein [Pyrinomonadaceae bacterium]|jgi:uncharacterized membrane protein|nr:DUF2085 domain-containing protein [Pyrinomonadaceae bacterium]